MTDMLTPERFSNLPDRIFRVEADGEIRLELWAVEKLGSGERPGGGFSLLFTGPGGDYLPQQVYRLHNAALGAVDIFLVPLGPRGDNHLYEAIFT